MYCNCYDCPMMSLFRQEFPGAPPPFGGPGGPSASQPPSSPPPSFAPSKSQAQVNNAKGFGATPYAVDPGAIRPCTFRFVYIWPRRGNGFWAWLTFVGRNSASGFRWNGRRWVYFGIDLRQIDSFVCY
ncbi:hypothetical protein [Clostridium thailandense]|nr:hypothetical protein [Clostridium thailandense]